MSEMVYLRGVPQHQRLILFGSLTTMDVQSRIKAYRFVAYAAITFSFVAVLSVCITLPMVYNYIRHVRQQMHTEITFCKVLFHRFMLFSNCWRRTKFIYISDWCFKVAILIFNFSHALLIHFESKYHIEFTAPSKHNSTQATLNSFHSDHAIQHRKVESVLIVP